MFMFFQVCSLFLLPDLLCQEICIFQALRVRTIPPRVQVNSGEASPSPLFVERVHWENTISVCCWMVCNLEMFQPSPDAFFKELHERNESMIPKSG